MLSSRFFPAEATQEIVDTIRPHFCPHDNTSTFRAQALLCLFLPSFSFTNELVNEVFDKWDWIGRPLAPFIHVAFSCAHFDLIDLQSTPANGMRTGFLFFSRFAKAAHSSEREVDWTPHLPQLFTHVLRILGRLPQLGQLG